MTREGTADTDANPTTEGDVDGDADPAHLPIHVARRLKMAPGAEARLSRLPPAPQLPELPDATAQDLMQLCGLEAADQAAMLAARPHPRSHPDWWWLLRGTVAELQRDMDKPLPAIGYTPWPTIPEGTGPVGMWLYAWTLLTVVPELLELHRRRGIDEQVTRDTLSGLGSLTRAHYDVTGVRGVGLFPLWGPPHTFTGLDFTIGRHTFTRCELAVGDGVAGWVLQVHIPPTGPLDGAASMSSMAQAEQFFARHFPEQPIAALVCISWVLDPQLREYLDPASNLIRFQQGFHLLPLAQVRDDSEGDREMMRLGLQLQTPAEGPLLPADLARVPSTTSLQRAFVGHVRAGRHWHKRTGVRWLVSREAGESSTLPSNTRTAG